MKKRYIALSFGQLALIVLSGWLRRGAWKEIDFGGGAWSPSVQLSFYCLAGWLATIAVAIWLAFADKTNRSMIVLFLVLLLPSIELLSWFVLSF